MDAHKDTPRIQILSVSETGRRRKWTDAAKVEIVEESYRGDVSVAEVARRHEISRSVLYEWRHRHKLGLLGYAAPFMRLVPLDGMPETAAAPPPSCALTIDLGERCRITIPANYDMVAAANLLTALGVAR